MKTNALRILAVIMLFSLNACYYDTLLEEEIPEIPEGQEISFSEDIEPLFSQSGKDCTQCHDGNPTDPDLRSGNAYNAIFPGLIVPGDADASEFYQNLPGVGQPFDVGFVLNTEEIALIRTWINRGAEDN
jgi:hypothetical protein